MAGLTILVLEDDVLIAEILSEMLEDMGHTVLGPAATEKKGIELAAQTRPDLLICDVTLEQGDGISAARAICATGVVPHFFSSGDLNRVKAMVPDAIVLEKPFRQGDVETAITRAMTAFGSGKPEPKSS